MIRRRRRQAEIPFSLDSFLDVVANVVGIIIKLILVAWVGARTYGTIVPPPDERLPTLSAPETPASVTDELAARRQQMEQAQARLLEQLRQVKEEENKASLTKSQLDALLHQRIALDQEKSKLVNAGAVQNQALEKLTPSLEELRERSLKVREELLALEKLPPLKKTLTYRTPVSRPVHAEELHFECREGKVSFIDVTAFIDEIKAGMEDKAELLRRRWEVDGTTSSSGPFRLRYTIERLRGPLDGDIPNEKGNFRYGLSRWEVDPISGVRGETVKEALTKGSAFERLVASAEGQQTVATLWVYPDSFDLYRQLRDYLQDHNLEVAGRPLPFGVPIASSRHGTASRGQ